VQGLVNTGVPLRSDPLTAFVTIAVAFVGGRWAAVPAVRELFRQTKGLWKRSAKG